MTLAALHSSGSLDGYVLGPPEPCADEEPEGVRLDREFCERARCRSCGHQGLHYCPVHRPGTYRFFGVCPSCCEAQEF